MDQKKIVYTSGTTTNFLCFLFFNIFHYFPLFFIYFLKKYPFIFKNILKYFKNILKISLNILKGPTFNSLKGLTAQRGVRGAEPPAESCSRLKAPGNQATIIYMCLTLFRTSAVPTEFRRDPEFHFIVLFSYFPE